MRYIAELKFRSHIVQINQDDAGKIYCFKYTNCRCELEVFDNQDEASEYIVTPMPSMEYVLHVKEEINL